MTLARWMTPAAFAALFAVQLFPAAALAWRRMGHLAEGRPVVLAVETRDPRDLLRGEYSTLAYEIGRPQGIGVAAVPPGCDLAARESCGLAPGRPVFMRLTPDASGVHRAVEVSFEPLPGDGVAVTGVLKSGTLARRGASFTVRNPAGRPEPRVCEQAACLTGFVTYGIETWYGPQGKPARLDRAARGDVLVEVRVATDGTAAIDGISVGGNRFAHTARLW